MLQAPRLTQDTAERVENALEPVAVFPGSGAAMEVQIPPDSWSIMAVVLDDALRYSPTAEHWLAFRHETPKSSSSALFSGATSDGTGAGTASGRRS